MVYSPIACDLDVCYLKYLQSLVFVHLNRGPVTSLRLPVMKRFWYVFGNPVRNPVRIALEKMFKTVACETLCMLFCTTIQWDVLYVLTGIQSHAVFDK